MSLSDQAKTAFGRDYLPICVTVIYIHLPESYKGGNLCLSGYGSIDASDVKKYKPKLGRKLTFRGDLLHHVEPIYCKGGKGKRISLVFEQYRLPESKVAAIKFDISKNGT
jgi:predicted 2-oxoglutarate/Fe(II)-dependent dioxygenase YbiX